MNATVRLTRSTVIDAPADTVWRLLRDFNSHESWHPAIAVSRIEAGEPADAVGAVRAFRLGDGSMLRERLLALSDANRELTYCLLEAPLPLVDYVATLRLRPVTDGDRTLIVWESRFRPPKERADALSQMVARDIYEAGFAALRTRFAAPGPQPAAAYTVVRAADPIAPPQRQAPAPLQAGAMASEAILVERHGGPEVMAAATVTMPPPGRGEVRLRHTAIGVNFIDIYCRTGYFSLLTPPDIPGMEAAGTVIDVGPGVDRIRPGDRVVYACEPVGAYTQIRTMDARLLVPLPDDIADETAAAVFLKGLAAEFLLHRVHAVQPGETVLVHAAAGGTGLLLCQWASAMGARVIGAVSSQEKAARARQAGCAAVVLYDDRDLAEAVRALTDGRGVDVVYEGVGAATFAQSLTALAVRGHVVSFGQASGPVGEWDIGALASKSITISRPNFGHYTTEPAELHAMAERLFDAVRRRIVVPAIDRRFPLRDAAAAHRRLESRDSIGSIILLP